MRGSVVVTGASSGIGAATARLLAERGFRAFGTYRRQEDAGPLEAAGAVPVPMDVTDAASIADARRAVEAGAGDRPLVGLVNNAGIPGAGPLELLPLEEFRRVLEVNVLGALAVTQAFLPALRASRGRIIMISSVSGRIPMPFAGPYAASKFALEGMSDSLRRELRPFGVEVVLVQPGAVRTRIWKRVEGIDLQPYRGTPYEPVMDRVREAALRAGSTGLPPDAVAEAVLAALTAARPRTRVPVLPLRGRLRLRLLEALPDRWLDGLIARRAWR